MPQTMKLKSGQIAQADDFINEFPDKYDTYIEQGGTMFQGSKTEDLLLQELFLKA